MQWHCPSVCLSPETRTCWALVQQCCGHGLERQYTSQAHGGRGLSASAIHATLTYMIKF